jgi:hypothetical protein
MIEKYFQLGVRYKWTKPGDVNTTPKDGAIVNSTRPTNQMIYDGLDVVVSPLLGATHVSSLGLSMRMPIQHVWLDYALGRTARIATGPYDVLTGFMSGCIIARWQDKGVTQVGHIGTITADATTNRLVKRTFSFAMPKGTTGFNPAAAWSEGELVTISRKYNPPRMAVVMALVTSGGDFYSIVMLPVDGRVLPKDATEWCAGGFKRVPPIGHDQLKLQLLQD